MSDFRWSLDWNRAQSLPGSDRTPLRPRTGASSDWARRRRSLARNILKAAHRRDRPAQPGGPVGGAAMIASVRAFVTAAARDPAEAEIAAALDLLDANVTELATPGARRVALTLAAGAMAAMNRQVHIPCLTETTARQLADILEPVLTAMGGRAAMIADQADIEQRADGHRADVVIASAARLAEDALRDREFLGPGARGRRSHVRRLCESQDFGALTRGVPVALVDDADLVMIDAPRPVGFGLDAEENAGRLRAEEAFVVLRALVSGRHYEVDPVTRRIRLTADGEARMDLAAALFAGPWQSRAWREETVLSALTVRDFFAAGQDYEIREDEVTLARSPGRFHAEPGIADLIAAKENVAIRTRMSRLLTYRQYLDNFGHLAGIGYGVAALSGDFRELYGLRARGAAVPRRPAAPAFVKAAERRFPDGAVIWAPTADDARAPGVDRSSVVTGNAVFSLPSPPAAIVQAGAASRGWSSRIADVYPDATVTAFADAADGFFAPLAPDEPTLAAFRAAPGPDTYRAAQAACEAAASDKRLRGLRSERFFERILAFAGDGP